MKAVEISMQLVKNVGNYESVRLMATYTIDPNENVEGCFIAARVELEQAYLAAYPPRQVLTVGTKLFERVCAAMSAGKADLELVKKSYDISPEAMTYLKTNELIP